MKKIFTLLFALVAMSAAASSSVMVDRCINVLLGETGPTIMAANFDANLDANHDGEITIDDVAVLIDMELQAKAANVNRAPAKEGKIVDFVKKVREAQTDDLSIDEAKKAIENERQDKE